MSFNLIALCGLATNDFYGYDIVVILGPSYCSSGNQGCINTLMTSAKSHMFFLASDLPFSLNHLGLLSFVKFLDTKTITNLPKFINSYKNCINSMLWLIWMKFIRIRYFKYSNGWNFFFNDICECECLVHKQRIILCKIITQ